jgi:DNA polymerase-3 subunit chi
MHIRADFYMIANKTQFVEQPLLLVCQLAQKAIASNQPCLIFCASIEQADYLDDLLWDFDDDAFVPHQIVGTDDDEDMTPILLVGPESQTPMRPLAINLRNELPPLGFQRVLEIVPAEDAARGPARTRWLAYKKLSFEVNKHDL